MTSLRVFMETFGIEWYNVVLMVVLSIIAYLERETLWR